MILFLNHNDVVAQCLIVVEFVIDNDNILNSLLFLSIAFDYSWSVSSPSKPDANTILIMGIPTQEENNPNGMFFN